MGTPLVTSGINNGIASAVCDGASTVRCRMFGRRVVKFRFVMTTLPGRGVGVGRGGARQGVGATGCGRRGGRACGPTRS